MSDAIYILFGGNWLEHTHIFDNHSDESELLGMHMVSHSGKNWKKKMKSKDLHHFHSVSDVVSDNITTIIYYYRNGQSGNEWTHTHTQIKHEYWLKTYINTLCI